MEYEVDFQNFIRAWQVSKKILYEKIINMYFSKILGGERQKGNSIFL